MLGAEGRPRVGIIMGSDSDLPTMRAAAEALEGLGVPAEVTVVSAHRTPDRMLAYARAAHTRGIQARGAEAVTLLVGNVGGQRSRACIGVRQGVAWKGEAGNYPRQAQALWRRASLRHCCRWCNSPN